MTHSFLTNSDKLAARYLLRPGAGRLCRTWLSRPFAGRLRRVVVYYHPASICWSQMFPFVHYADSLASAYEVSFRFVPVDRFLEGDAESLREGDIVFVQPWFTTPTDVLKDALARQKDRWPAVPIIFFDSYAHNDLRLGATVHPFIERYVKKSLFMDQSLYMRPFRGDTNLTDYYGDLYGLSAEPVDWHTPSELMPKLALGASFLTDPRFILHQQNPPGRRHELRRTDIQVRFDTPKNDWYGAMRRQALQIIDGMEDVSLSSRGRVDYKAYMAEMADCRLCISPFGYGELCWRDVEAIFCGTLLIKQDMSHLRTLPNLYEPGVSYLPVKWDFSNLEEVVRGALADPEGTRRISRTARDRLLTYLRTEQFVPDMAFLFAH